MPGSTRHTGTDMNEAQHSFGIKNAKDLLKKLHEEVADFKKEEHSSRHAINAAFTAWHLHEWVWGMLKSRYADQQLIFGRPFKNYGEFLDFLLTSCDALAVMRDISNGSKHLNVDRDSKAKVTGTTLHPQSEAPYGAAMIDLVTGQLFQGPIIGTATIPAYLTVTCDDGSSILFRTYLDQVLHFWDRTLG
jgi:hypothetical protein